MFPQIPSFASSGTSGVTAITSADSSVTIVNPTGPTVDLSVPPTTPYALPDFVNCLSDLSLDTGTLDGTHSYAYKWVPNGTEANGPVAVQLFLVLATTGTPPYTIQGLPAVQFGFTYRGTIVLLNGRTLTGGLGTWTTAYRASVDGDGEVDTDTAPSLGIGDVLFTGNGIYPWNPN